MKRAGGFDLSNYADVNAHADDILKHLQAGDMPCDGAWPETELSHPLDWRRCLCDQQRLKVQ